ncbi:MAG: hypothetical protein ACK5Y2_06565 [Bdellovibrionales bacterium]
MFFGRKLVYLMGILFILVIASAFQTVFWYQILGHLTPPLLWLSVLNYVILARQAPQSLFFAYLLAIAASALSSTHVGLLLTIIFCYYWLIVIVKNNFYIESTSYFVLINFGGAVAFHVLFLLISTIVEDNPTKILFLDRMTQILLTPLFSVPMYIILKKWEKITKAPEIYMDTSRYESE